MRTSRSVRWASAAAALVIALWLPGVVGRGDLVALTTSAVFAITALGVVILTGWAGQSSLAQVTFMGIGAYTYGRLNDDLSMPLYLAAPIAVAVSSALSVVVGLPALRLRGVYLAIVTLAFAQVTDSAAFSNNALTNSQNGLGVQRPVLGPLDLTGDHAIYVFCLLVLVGCCLIVAALRRTAFARELFAVQATELGAAVRGVSLTRAKLGAFAVAAAFAGLGGVCYGMLTQGLNPILFQPLESVFLLGVVVIGGQRSIRGALVAGLLFGMLRVELARQVSTSTLGSNIPFLVTGVGLLVVVIGREYMSSLAETARRLGGSLPRVGRPKTPEAVADATA